jgi:ABC-type branched-subunit amino acid transport system substrate-binding protein
MLTPGLPVAAAGPDPHFVLPQPSRPGPAPRRRKGRKLRVAHFVTMTGTAGIWGLSAVNSALLAATEINARGGILGHEIELSVHDAGVEEADLVREAENLVVLGEADVVMGCHMSCARVSLREALAGRAPYIYTPIYEGGEGTPGVLAIGETPRCQARPAIEWLADKKNARRWYLIGSDYIWPRLSHQAVKRYIADSGGCVVGEDFVPLNQSEYADHVERIKVARPDAVFISLIGLDGILFNRLFAERGLSTKMLRLANCVDETVLLGIGAENTDNLFAASGYFAGVPSASNESFRAAYRESFGAVAPVPGAIAQSNYEGLYFLDALSRRAEALDVRSLVRAAEGLVYSGGRGEIGMHERRTDMPIYLAQADGFDFRLLDKF